jgi:4-diphosphocytidyl-2-C-methyl-D-erythritol kinase
MTDFIAGDCRNECRDMVCLMYPQVKNALIALSKFSEAKLTGTGACVFAQFSSEEGAQAAYAALKDDWEVFVAKGLNKSPLSVMLQQG